MSEIAPPVNSDVRCFLFEISMRVLNHAKLSAEAVTDIPQELSGQENLKDVMAATAAERQS